MSSLDNTSKVSGWQKSEVHRQPCLWRESWVMPARAARLGSIAPADLGGPRGVPRRSPLPRPRCRERWPRASGSRVSPARCRRASRREKAVSQGEGVRWLRLGCNTKLLGLEKRLHLHSARPERGPPLPPPPRRPESQGNRKHIRVSSRWHLFLLFTEV